MRQRLRQVQGAVLQRAHVHFLNPHAPLRQWVRQVKRPLRAAVVRLAHGLPPAGDALIPQADPARWAALLPLYRWAAAQVAGEAVLELACGTGYGTRELAAGGAHRVVGVDANARLLRHARRHTQEPHLSFVEADLAALPPDLGTFGGVVACDLLPRLANVDALLESWRPHVAAGGLFLADLPVVTDLGAMQRHRADRTVLTPHFLWDWAGLLGDHFAEVAAFAPGPQATGDFVEIPLHELDFASGPRVVFRCRSAG